MPFEADGQAVQLVPQLLTLLLLWHVVPHTWKPGLQENPQLEPLHVALPLVGAAQGVHANVPQLLVLLLLTQALEHTC